MLIIIEGCDGTGKSTFAEKLGDRILRHESALGTNRDVAHLHAGPLEHDALESYEMALAEYDPNGVHLIIDRWHWGETVYGPLYRNESKLTPAGLYHVDKYIDSRGGVAVLLEQFPEELRARLKDRGEDFLKDEHIEQVLDGFTKTFTQSVMTEKHKMMDPSDTDIAATVILGYVRENYANDLTPFGTYVGPRFPEFLLLGDVRKKPEWQAAFVPQNATSGKFLLDSLSRAVLAGSGLANACEENVKELYELLNAPKTVTLGVNARKAADEAGIPHFNVPHPQYIRRFHNSKQREYGQVIARGLFGEEVDDWLSSESQT